MIARLAIPLLLAALTACAPLTTPQTDESSSFTDGAPEEATVHVVRQGDTLWEIAQAHGVTVAQIRSLNSLGISSRIYPGQRLMVSALIDTPAPVMRPDTVFSVAVLPLDCPGLSDAEITTLTELLRTALLRTGLFDVMERAKMEDILYEQGFQLSGCVTTQCVVEAGQSLAVRNMVAGNVGRVGNTYAVSLRVFDVETGRTVSSVTEFCEACPIDRVMQLTIPRAAAALSGDVLRRVRSGR
jgi:LysM repeat protein